jgi:serine/threonine protein kinase
MAQTVAGRADDRMRLPAGTLLDGVYEIEGEIGAGGFGITYRARDRTLRKAVAIKEYFPAAIGMRDDTLSIVPSTAAQGDVFKWGLEHFLAEARMLAGFKHPGIVAALRCFELNSTAYIVLDYEDGAPFGSWLKSLGQEGPAQAELDRITRALCDALETVHGRGIVHRDIAPDNIIIRPDGSPVLLDFGAARQEMIERSKVYGTTSFASTYAVVKSHYSPFEQRLTDKRTRGPWSDVYSLGATLYRAVTGKLPMDALERVAADEDPLPRAVAAAKGQYRRSFLEAIDKALAIRHQDRLQSIKEFMAIAFAVDGHARPPQAAGRSKGATFVTPHSAILPNDPERRPPMGPRDSRTGFAGPPTVVGVRIDQTPTHPADGDARSPRPWRRTPVAIGLAIVMAMAIGTMVLLSEVLMPKFPEDLIAFRDATRDSMQLVDGALDELSHALARRDATAARGHADRVLQHLEDARRNIARMHATARRDDGRVLVEDYVKRAEAADQRLKTLRQQIAEIEKPTSEPPKPVHRPEPPAPTPAVPTPPVTPPATAPGAPPPAPVARGPSLWTHNRSTMRLVAEGRRRRFIYEFPKASIEQAGAVRGTLLFDGERVGDTYSGIAFIFSRTCGPKPYNVSGDVSPDQRRVEMRGMKPTFDRSCQKVGEELDILVFEYIELTLGEQSGLRAIGDEHIVDGLDVNVPLNVRIAPDPKSPIVTRLERGQRGIYVIQEQVYRSEQGNDQYWTRIEVKIDDVPYQVWVNRRHLQTVAILDSLRRQGPENTFVRQYGKQLTQKTNKLRGDHKTISDCETACLKIPSCRVIEFYLSNLSCGYLEARPKTGEIIDHSTDTGLVDVSIRGGVQPPTPTRLKVAGWQLHVDRWVEGDGYLKPPPRLGNAEACAALCLHDRRRCRMFEYHQPTRKCGLFDHTQMKSGQGKSIVGIMNW